MIADQLLEIMKYQNAAQSNIPVAPYFRDFIETINTYRAVDDKFLYNMSLTIQPRQENN